MKISAKKLVKDAILPRHNLPGDAGLDLHSIEDAVINPGERALIGTGLSFALPEGYVSLIWDKSGIALKNGIKSMGGVIEHTYRGEYKVILFNTSNKKFIIKKGDKIAQMLVQPIMSIEVDEVEELDQTIRGNHGFGSAG